MQMTTSTITKPVIFGQDRYVGVASVWGTKKRTVGYEGRHLAHQTLCFIYCLTIYKNTRIPFSFSYPSSIYSPFLLLDSHNSLVMTIVIIL